MNNTYPAESVVITSQMRLLAKIERFSKRTGLSLTAFGLQALNDPGFVGDLRKGRSPQIDTVEKLQQFMKEYAK